MSRLVEVHEAALAISRRDPRRAVEGVLARQDEGEPCRQDEGTLAVGVRGTASDGEAVENLAGARGKLATMSEVPPRIPLPDHLRGRPFALVEGRQAGLGTKRLYGPDLERPTWGTRAAECEDSLTLRCHALLEAVSRQELAFSHLTAVRLLGLPAPGEWTPKEEIHLMHPLGGLPIRRSGVREHAGTQSREIIHTDTGLPVVAPVTTWADLAWKWNVTNLVVLGDALVNEVGTTTVHRMILSRRGQRGVRKMRIASQLIRFGSGSPMETRARLTFGNWLLPEPVLNEPVLDNRGRLIGRPDFAWPEHRVAAEYEGDYHRTERDQWEYDILRQRQFEAAGWRYVRITQRALIDPREGQELRNYLRRLLRPVRLVR